MNEWLQTVIDAIDAANALDPNHERNAEGKVPGALLYGRRMSAELQRVAPDASELLRIAARGQHIERWKLPRRAYPEGRPGYLAWRKAQAAAHGRRVADLMAAAGYAETECRRFAAMLRKTGIKREPEVQLLEDIACLVFLRWHFAGFTAGRDPEQLRGIVRKTARKMSEAARADCRRVRPAARPRRRHGRCKRLTTAAGGGQAAPGRSFPT